MMRHLFIFIGVFIFMCSVSGQEGDTAKISFVDSVCDFGLVYEADGNIPVSYKYINTGNKPLLINRVISPGFILKNWTKEYVLPGDTGKIELEVNPFHNSGYYLKDFRVFTNAINSPSDLRAKGKIINGSYKQDYKYNVGGLALKYMQVNFGYIYSGKQIIRLIPVLNSSKIPVSVRFDSLPEYLTVIPRFDSLMPGKNGIIEFVYNTNMCNDWDYVIDRIQLKVTSDKIYSENITITSNIREDFSKLTEEELKFAPRITMPERIYNFGNILHGDSVQYKFLLKNDGAGDLAIRAVKPTCGCTVASLDKDILPPGDSVFIKVNFYSAGYSGDNKKGVTVITNDPENYKQLLWITGFVDD